MPISRAMESASMSASRPSVSSSQSSASKLSFSSTSKSSSYSSSGCISSPPLAVSDGCILPSALLRQRASAASPTCLWVHVLGEPVVRELGAGALAPRLGEDIGAGGGELQAGADVVDEAGDLSRALPALRALGEEVGEIGEAVHLHAAVVPPAARAFFLPVRRALHDVVVVLRLAAVREDHALA